MHVYRDVCHMPAHMYAICTGMQAHIVTNTHIYIYIDTNSQLCTHKFDCPTHAHTNACSEAFTSTQTNIYI